MKKESFRQKGKGNYWLAHIVDFYIKYWKVNIYNPFLDHRSKGITPDIIKGYLHTIPVTLSVTIYICIGFDEQAKKQQHRASTTIMVWGAIFS